MSNQGYVIAKSSKSLQYFTASSPYDNPTWISLDEATVYPTAEIAQAAVTKLFKRGAFSASVVSLTEFALPMTNVPAMSTINTQPATQQPNAMVSNQQEEVCPTCDHEPCTCPHTDDDEDDDNTNDTTNTNDTMSVNGQDVKLKTEGTLPVADDETEKDGEDCPACSGEGTESQYGGAVCWMCKGSGQQHSSPMGKVDESAAVVNEAGISTEVHKIEIKDPAEVIDHNRDAGTTVADSGEAKIKVPAAVVTALKAAIEIFNKCSDPETTQDETKSSHCMTVASALQGLLTDLELGTVTGLKMAQVHMTSYMSPISNHIPTVVNKFIGSGGAKMTLKDMYNDKWDAARIGDM